MTAQNIGAGYADRCRQVLRYALTIAVSYGILVALVIQFTAEPIVGWFTSDPAVIKAGGQYFRSYVIDAIFAGVHFCFSGFFVAYGYSIVSFIHNVASIVLARVPLSYILSINFPETLLPMGFAAPAGSLLSVLICLGFFIYFRRHGKAIGLWIAFSGSRTRVGANKFQEVGVGNLVRLLIFRENG
jgi:Na+-driven multidrug efflux pump